MLDQKVLQTINTYNLINENDSIVVGVSGGPDSICLLDIFIKLKQFLNFKIYVAHINHGIRKQAIDDQKYVEQYCKKNNIECFVKQEDISKVAKQEKIGLEVAGRNIRYKFFEEILIKTKSNKIATAHTKNDSAETVLMNIIRGAGTLRIKWNSCKKR